MRRLATEKSDIATITLLYFLIGVSPFAYLEAVVSRKRRINCAELPCSTAWLSHYKMLFAFSSACLNHSNKLADEIRILMYAVTYLFDVMCSQKLDYEKAWLRHFKMLTAFCSACLNHSNVLVDEIYDLMYAAT